MTDYKDKLSGFAERLKSNTNTTPIQEVKPIKQQTERIVRATVYLPEELHTLVKVFCAQKQISFKDFIIQTVEDRMKSQL